MSLKNLVLAGVVLILSTGVVFADPPGRKPVDLEKDVYVILYKRRVDISQARAAFARAQYDRARRLVQSNSISREEYDLAASAVAVQNAIIGESDALLDIARARREHGLDMPIFPHQFGDAYTR